MKILDSSNIFSCLNEENRKNKLSSKQNRSNRDRKNIWDDILENIYLIIFSMVPLIFYPIFAYSLIENANIIEEIFLNPDLMLLPIPYILHCVLSISAKKGIGGTRSLIGSCFILVVLVLLFYLVLKLNMISSVVGKIVVIWGGMLTTIILSIIGSFKSFCKETMTT